MHPSMRLSLFFSILKTVSYMLAEALSGRKVNITSLIPLKVSRENE